MQKTIEGAFALNDKIWKNISQEAKNLVTKLLENDPHDRISLDDALKHPWFTTNRSKFGSSTSMHLSKPVLATEQ